MGEMIGGMVHLADRGVKKLVSKALKTKTAKQSKRATKRSAKKGVKMLGKIPGAKKALKLTKKSYKGFRAADRKYERGKVKFDKWVMGNKYNN